jgi:hypothetical protein
MEPIEGNGKDAATDSTRSDRAWLRLLIEKWQADILRIAQLLHISIKGLSVFRTMPNAMKVLAAYEGRQNEPSEVKKLEALHEEAALATSELEAGFPALHAQAATLMWAHLEILVRDFIAGWIRYEPRSLQAPIFGKIKVPLSELIALNSEQRNEVVVELVEREVGAGLRKGVDRFEALLAPFDLAGEVPAELRKTIYELAQVRNAIVHRAMRVDSEIVEACPWLELVEGTELRVTNTMFSAYFEAACKYSVLLIERATEKDKRNRKLEQATKTA